MNNMRSIPLAVVLAVSLVLAGCTLPAPPGSGTSPTTSGSTVASVSGRVWDDQCPRPQGGETLTIAPQGCLPDGSGGFRSNGTFDSGEAGLAAIKVALASGPCPAEITTTTDTSADGIYAFADLTPGTYCISIDSTTNAAVLGAGGWSSPAVSPGGLIGATVDLQAGQVISNVNFGWDRGAGGAQVEVPTPEPTLAPEMTSTPEPTATPEATATPNLTATPQASASITVSPSPTFASGDPKAGLGTPTFRDTFESAANWPVYEDDHVKFAITDGDLKMTAFNADHWNGWMLTYNQSQDSYIELTATSGTCSGLDQFGIVARSSGTSLGYVGYFFGITCDGRYSLRTWDGEKYTRLVDWTASADILSGSDKTNRLGLKLDGTRIGVYVNGKLLKEVVNDAYSGGIYGVFVGASSTANFTVTATEFAAWDLP